MNDAKGKLTHGEPQCLNEGYGPKGQIGRGGNVKKKKKRFSSTPGQSKADECQP